MTVRGGVIGMLLADHRKVQALFTEYEAAADPSTRRLIAENACTELEHHAELEAMVFYPAFELAATEQGRQFVDESIQEHGVVAILIEEMRGLETDDPRFSAKFQELRNTVEGHITQEETCMFPEAEEALLDQGEELWLAMQELKRQLLLPEP